MIPRLDLPEAVIQAITVVNSSAVSIRNCFEQFLFYAFVVYFRKSMIFGKKKIKKEWQKHRDSRK